MRSLNSEQRRAVRLDMVGVAVPSVSVISEDNMGAETADLGDDLFRDFVYGAHPERVGEEVGWRVEHAGVAVAEELDLVHLEDATRLAQFGLANLGETRSGGLLGHVRIDDGRELAIGAADHTGLHTSIGVCGERATHGDRLVIAVRVHRHEPESCVCHHSSTMVTDRITSSLRIEPTTSMPLMTWPNR